MANALSRLTAVLGAGSYTTSTFRDNCRVHLPAELLITAMKFLKLEAGFDMLAELTAVDYLHYPKASDRFQVIYGLTNTSSGERLWVKVPVNDPHPTVESVTGLWKSADWMEREVYDLYGVFFAGHPDLRRILMPEEFLAHPLRKDYPLRGRGERHNFASINRSES